MFVTQKDTESFGPSWSGWALIVTSVLATPVVLGLALITAMERDSTYLSILFPVPYLVHAFSGIISELSPAANKPVASFFRVMAAVLALLQFPVYATVFAFTRRRETVIPALGVAHFLLAVAAFLTFVLTGR